MSETTFSNWNEINKMTQVQHMLAEVEEMSRIDITKLRPIMEEDGGLVQVEGVRFTPGGNFVKALARNGQVVETAIELVAQTCNCETARAAYGHWLSCEKCATVATI